MNENSLALFQDSPNPLDAITNAIDLLEVVRENFSTENQDHGVWLQLGIVGDTIRAALPRIKPARMIGEQFAKVKANLKDLRNGDGWRGWCEKRLGFSHTQAQNYINEFENGGLVKNLYNITKLNFE